MKIFPIYCLLAITLLLSSCETYTPFTQRLYAENGWTERDLQHIQFYVSEEIVLRRQLKESDSKITDGKIKIVDGRQVEEVVIPKCTPGILVFSPKDNRFAVSFDDADDKYLMFGPNKKQNGKYLLLASDWDRNRGKITYNNKIYTTDSESAYAELLVDLTAMKKSTVKRKTAKGRKVN